MRLAIALGLALAPSLASADVVDLKRAGAWSVTGGMRADGRSVCTITSTVFERGEASISFEQVGQETSLSLILSKPTWSIPPGTMTTASFVFGYGSPMVQPMVGTGGALIVHVSTESALGFLSKLEINNLRVEFKGDEPPWGVLSAYLYTVQPIFLDCLRQQRPASPPKVTQPF